MILENMSLPSAGATADDKGLSDENGASSATTAISDNSMKPKIIKQAVTSADRPTVNAINSNTFVVKLEPSGGNQTSGSSNKTNLLRLFRENGNGVKALGIGRIVINRTLLKNAKNNSTKSPATPPTIIRLNTAGLTKAPVMLRGAKEKENTFAGNAKKDDEISSNLANFMNFKLSNIVPTPLKTDSPSSNIFKVNLKPPEERTSLTNECSSSLSSQSPLKSSDGKLPQSLEDDELTNLSWLTDNDKDLLKTIRSCNPDDIGISLSGDESEEDEELNVAPNNNAVFTAKSRVESSSQGGFATRQYGQPYSPNGKPPYSFSCLIFMAVEDSPDKMLPVKEIYSWVCKHFPYFQTAPSGWKNSIRHNLSLNKCFKKVEHGKHSHDPGKGSLWCIDPAYRPNLIQALKRTPFYPYLYPSGIGQPLSLNNLVSLLPTARSGKIPLWSPNLSQQVNSSYDPDVASAALNLIGLKGNDAIDKSNVQSTIKELAAEIFSRNDDAVGTIPIVIKDPADDHTYSTFSFVKPKSEVEDDGRCPSPESDKSAPDAAYEFETCGTDFESDEERLSIDLDGDSECDLADSGFVGLKGGKRKGRNKRRKNLSSLSPSASKRRRTVTKSSTRSSSKSTQTPPKQGLKVRFPPKSKAKTSPRSSAKERKRKSAPKKTGEVLTSDVDSGKDSPKVTTKTRKRTPAKKSPTPLKKKNRKAADSARKSPYGTRSSTQTRHSKRIGGSEGNILQRASARKRKQDSVSLDSEDEEIKLAAGSLLHLAGFRSPA